MAGFKKITPIPNPFAILLIPFLSLAIAGASLIVPSKTILSERDEKACSLDSVIDLSSFLVFIGRTSFFHPLWFSYWSVID